MAILMVSDWQLSSWCLDKQYLVLILLQILGAQGHHATSRGTGVWRGQGLRDLFDLPSSLPELQYTTF